MTKPLIAVKASLERNHIKDVTESFTIQISQAEMSGKEAREVIVELQHAVDFIMRNVEVK